MGGVAIVVGKGSCEQLSFRSMSMFEMSEVDCSASTSLDSSIVFISHLQSVLCFTLASYI